MILSWKRARTLGRRRGIPDVGYLELKDGLTGCVRKLEPKIKDLEFRRRTLITPPDAKRPTAEFVNELERERTSELKSVQADESTLARHADDSPLLDVSAARVENRATARETTETTKNVYTMMWIPH